MPNAAVKLTTSKLGLVDEDALLLDLGRGELTRRHLRHEHLVDHVDGDRIRCRLEKRNAAAHEPDVLQKIRADHRERLNFQRIAGARHDRYGRAECGSAQLRLQERVRWNCRCRIGAAGRIARRDELHASRRSRCCAAPSDGPVARSARRRQLESAHAPEPAAAAPGAVSRPHRARSPPRSSSHGLSRLHRPRERSSEASTRPSNR